MKNIPFAALLSAIICAAATALSAAPRLSENDALALLKKLPAKNRLFSDFAFDRRTLEQRFAGTPLLGDCLARADALLPLPPRPRIMEGRRLLSTSSEILGRITHLAMAYHLTGNAAYAERGKAETLNLVRFQDWNPAHFLDTGEAALAAAIGYDWLYDSFTAEEREEIRRALVEKALRPGLAGNPGWRFGVNNWTQVCHAGLLAAALIAADDVPDLAAKTVANAVNSQEAVMRESYSANGIYPEGISYWVYGTGFQAATMALLHHAFLTDFGLESLPGWDRTGGFTAAARGPSGLGYNYGDNSTRTGLCYPHFYLAGRFQQPGFLVPVPSERQAASPVTADVASVRLMPLALLCPPPPRERTSPPPRVFWTGDEATVPVALLRAGTVQEELFLGIKGGKPNSNHGHMDNGSFVFDAGPVRWVEDPGSENYTRIEALEMNLWSRNQFSDRWKLFRLGPEGHSILRLADRELRVDGYASMALLPAQGDALPEVQLDLSPLFAGDGKVIRRAKLAASGLQISDQASGLKPGTPVRFQFLTRARVVKQWSNQLEMSCGERRLTVLAPAGSDWEIVSATQLAHSFDTVEPDWKRLSFTRHADASGSVSGTVEFLPHPAPRLSEPEARTLLKKLPERHRILTNPDFKRETLESQPLSKAMIRRILTNADAILKLPPLHREMLGRRLQTAYRLPARVSTLSAAWHLTGNPAYADRAKEEVLLAASYADWNPAHFLDTARISLGVALGYDWLYDRFTPEERRTIRQALIENVLKQGLSQDHWWRFCNNNWAQVCHLGMLAAALIVSDDAPDLAARAVTDAVNAQERVMRECYAANGIYPEGPGYWSASSDQVLLLNMLTHAFHTDFGLESLPGWDRTGQFFAAVRGPSGRFYNFADSDTEVELRLANFYLASRFHEPACLPPDLLKKFENFCMDGVFYPENGVWALFPMLLCYPPPLQEWISPPPRVFWSGDGATVPVALLRAGSGQEELFLGIKGGKPDANHGHMDNGSFVFDAGPVRWVEDPGSENYTRIEALEMNLWSRNQFSDRWKLFRLGPEGHSILRLADRELRVDGYASMALLPAQGDALPEVQLDLSPLFAGDGKVIRRAKLAASGLQISDQASGLKPGTPVRFQFLTRARVVKQWSNQLEMSCGERRLTVLAPAGSDWEIVSATQLAHSFDTVEPDWKRLSFTRHADASGSVSGTVEFLPHPAAGRRP